MDTEAKVFSLLTNEVVKQDDNKFYWNGLELTKEFLIAYWARRYCGYYITDAILETTDEAVCQKSHKLDRFLRNEDPYEDNPKELFTKIMFTQN